MDTEASFARSLSHLQDAVSQANFYLSQAIQCSDDEPKAAILRMAQQTLRDGLDRASRAKVVDL